MGISVNLDNLIAPTFRRIMSDIINCDVDTAILNGGRNTTKSQIVSEGIVVGCMTFRESAVALVKYGNKIEERLVNTFRESIRFLGVEAYWKLRRAPFEYVLLDAPYGRETDVSIKFTGADTPENLKSFKPRRGAFRYIWFEELSNFKSYYEFNSIGITMARGEGKHTKIATYNPPKSTSNWCNQQFDAPIGTVLGADSNLYYERRTVTVGSLTIDSVLAVHHSTYLDIIGFHPEWLGSEFIASAELARTADNDIEYRHTYLGEVVGTQSNVFLNIHETDFDVASFREINRGLDMSNGGSDPHFYIETYYSRKENSLYVVDEICTHGSIDELGAMIKQKNKNNFGIYMDAAVPLFKTQLQSLGLNVQGAVKAKDSVRAGILWLQSMSAIHFNKTRTPKAYAEFKGLEYIIRNDVITHDIQGTNDHSIAAARYGNSNNIKYL